MMQAAAVDGDGARDAVLASVLNAHQLRVRVVDVSDYCGRWFENEPQTPQGSFHLIDRGSCWVRSASLDAPLHLAAGDLNAANLAIGHAALDANDYLVYNPDTGNLAYDADGSGAGGTVLIANLANHVALTAADFFVI